MPKLNKGHLQQRIMAYLDGLGWIGVPFMAGEFFTNGPTQSQKSSIQRAVRSLVTSGLLEIRPLYYYDNAFHHNPQYEGDRGRWNEVRLAK